jgi:hypothetical protein
VLTFADLGPCAGCQGSYATCTCPCFKVPPPPPDLTLRISRWAWGEPCLRTSTWRDECDGHGPRPVFQAHPTQRGDPVSAITICRQRRRGVKAGNLYWLERHPERTWERLADLMAYLNELQV